ncbi:MAG TPA: UV DNA damage repair endonuclease UvsE [Candidatus Bathyarchaeia archaeon]
MRIGYPCINRSLTCSGNKTFRLKSYSESRLKETVRNNLDCLLKILEFNIEHGLFFFRITSDLVPFASHPINTFNWQNYFRSNFESIGDFISRNRLRISMHPDQFTLINSVRDEIFERSKKELNYHVTVLDLMNLDNSSKIQIHVGGAYGNKRESMGRFVARFQALDERIRRRLVIENDDKLYDVSDCLKTNAQTGIPVLFDVFHHRLNNKTQAGKDYFERLTKTWNEEKDGFLMVDYSSQKPGGLAMQHADTIDLEDFNLFLKSTESFDFDIMLEIKDKEKSALRAIKWAANDHRVRRFIEGHRGF